MDFDLGHYRSRPNGLRELYTGDMTWRELWDFMQHLPPESATSRVLYGEAALWTPSTTAVAHAADALTYIANMLQGLFRKKGVPPPKPLAFLERPDPPGDQDDEDEDGEEPDEDDN